MLCGKHFCQEVPGSERTRKRTPPKMRTAPAEPAQAADHASRWCSGTERSLDSKASTDRWKIRTETRTRTPARVRR